MVRLPAQEGEVASGAGAVTGKTTGRSRVAAGGTGGAEIRFGYGPGASTVAP